MAPTARDQDRADAKPSVTYDDYIEGCPHVRLMNIIGSRWASLALTVLGQQQGRLRYGALSRALPGVTQKMLTQTLRSLERDGLIARTVTATIPPRVDYELTELGRSLHRNLAALNEWAAANIDQVEIARDRYDATQAVPAPTSQ